MVAAIQPLTDQEQRHLVATNELNAWVKAQLAKRPDVLLTLKAWLGRRTSDTFTIQDVGAEIEPTATVVCALMTLIDSGELEQFYRVGNTKKEFSDLGDALEKAVELQGDVVTCYRKQKAQHEENHQLVSA